MEPARMWSWYVKAECLSMYQFSPATEGNLLATEGNLLATEGNLLASGVHMLRSNIKDCYQGSLPEHQSHIHLFFSG